MEIVFATSNKNKAEEIQRLLPDSIKVKTLEDIGFEGEIPETSTSLQGNALQKARYMFENYSLNCFADDTGLEVHSLNGEPGVYSARYAGPQKSPDDNMDLVLEKLNGQLDRSARFRTVISLIIDGEELQFEGIVEGEIATTKSGMNGFGYDPIFCPSGFDQSFSEMSIEQKNEISHRGKAVRKLSEYLSAIMP
jgi:XTP/dITP diphosphohydrolase